MIAVTGASGHLGRLVVELLLQKLPAAQLVALVRRPERASDLAAMGVQVRMADYEAPETLTAALRGVDHLLLVSSSEVGQRERQHRAVIAAAQRAGIRLLAYTSLLHADRSSMSLAVEHRATEAAIRDSGIPFVLLRNGWYLENYTEHLGPALEHGALIGAAKQGRIAAAGRADYAAAAAAVLTSPGHEGEVYELAGDQPFTMAELAAEVARQAGKPVAYHDLTAEKYAGALRGAGLPAAAAEMYASADEGIARGDLDDTSGDLRRLIGRPTTTLAQAVGAALKRA